MGTASAITAVSRYEAALERAMAYLSAATVVAMMLLTTADVVLRYTLNRPIQDSFELSQFMLVGLVFLGIPYLQSIRGHVTVEFITNRLSATTRRFWGIVGHAIGLFAFAVVTWRTAHFAWQAWETGDFTMGIIQYPLWPAKSVIPLGTGLLCIRLMLDIVQDSIMLWAGRHKDAAGTLPLST